MFVVVECPKCGRRVDDGAFICPACEFILDTSFLGDDITDDEKEKRVAKRAAAAAAAAALAAPLAGASAPKPRPQVLSSHFGEDAIILGNGRGEYSDFASKDAAGLRKEVTQARFYIGGSAMALLSPDAVPEVVPGMMTGARMTPFEQHVLAFINGMRSIGRIKKKSAIEESEFKTSVAMLADKGIIRLRTTKKPKKKAGFERPAIDRAPPARVEKSPASSPTMQRPADKKNAPASAIEAAAALDDRTRHGKQRIASAEDDTLVRSQERRPEAAKGAGIPGFASMRIAASETEAGDGEGWGGETHNVSNVFARVTPGRPARPSLVDSPSRPRSKGETSRAAKGTGSTPQRSPPPVSSQLSHEANVSARPTDGTEVIDRPLISAKDSHPQGNALQGNDLHGDEIKDNEIEEDATAHAVAADEIEAVLADASLLDADALDDDDEEDGEDDDAPGLDDEDEAGSDEDEEGEYDDEDGDEDGEYEDDDDAASDEDDDAIADEPTGPLPLEALQGDDDDDGSADTALRSPTDIPPVISRSGSLAPTAFPRRDAALPTADFAPVSPVSPAEPLARSGGPPISAGPPLQLAGLAGLQSKGAMSTAARPSAASTVPFEQARKAEKIFEQAVKDHMEGRLSSARMNAKLAAMYDPSVDRYREFLAELEAAGAGKKDGAKPREVQLFEDANAAEGRGDYQAAVSLLRQAIEIAPNAAPLRNKIGVVLSVRLKRHREAMDQLKIAIDLDPNNMVIMNNYSKVAANLESDLDKRPIDDGRSEKEKKNKGKDDKIQVKKVRPKIF